MDRSNPRKFRQGSYDRNNKYGIDIIHTFLKSKGYTIIEKAEDYKADIETIKDGKKVLFEAEVKALSFTDRASFRYNTVSFAARKKRYGDFWYIIISRYTDWACMAHSSVIFDPKYYEDVYVNTEVREGMDKFYRVPKERVHFFKIKNESTP